MESCFICGVRMGRGNQPTIGRHERMSKLVSVSHTVNQSSTVIISDILSRILKETIGREETICRICFNLLNDIDYHLKEAQEKTDEITDKFLDKGKDPLNYKPAPIVTTEKESPPTASTNKTRRGHRKAKKENSPKVVVPSVEKPEDLFEDEMSVNTLNKNKQKILCHVLNPSKKVKQTSSPDKVTTPALPDPPRLSLNQPMEEEEFEDLEESEDDSDPDYSQAHEARNASGKKRKGKENRDDHEPVSKKSRKFKAPPPSQELSTVNLDDLGDILTTPKAFFAKKSEPVMKSGKKASKKSIPEELISPEESQLVGEDEELGSTPGVTCQICGKMFKMKSNLHLHMERVHMTNPALVAVDERQIPETHKCHLCPREFTNEKSLTVHKSEHSAEALESRSMTVNVKVVKPPTDSEVKATCPQCHKTFRRHFNMRIHVDRVHNKLKNFPCSKCDKSFATNSDLKQHMNVHGDGRVLNCEECDRTFTNRDSYIFHKKQHTNTRTHFCVICKKGFFKSSCLNRHMRSHTGERPYKCDYCGKGFSQSTSLKVHMAKCGQNPGSEPPEVDVRAPPNNASGGKNAQILGL